MLAAVFIACTAVLAPAAVSASPVTFGFTGSLTDDPFGLSRLGAPISGAFSFDSTAVDMIAALSTGSYSSSGNAYRFDANVDGMAYSALAGTTVNTANDIGGVDQYGAIAIYGDLTLELFLQDPTATSLSSAALPLTPPSLGAFAIRQFRLFSDSAEFLGDVTGLVCTSGCAVHAVPEPNTLLLLSLGGAALLVVSASRVSRRRRRA